MAIQTHINNSRNTDFGLPLIGSVLDSSPIETCCDGGFDELGRGMQQKSHIFYQGNLNHLPNLPNEQFQYQNLTTQMEKQQQDIKQFIRSQNERLRFVVQKQRREQTETIVKLMESKASVLMVQKDQEILKASVKKLELASLLQKMETENQRWQIVAKENELMVMNLKNMLAQAREREREIERVNEAVEDEGSCCGVGGEEGCLDGEKMGENVRVCKSCGSRDSCVVFLPCRHLSSCRDCEGYLDSCPVCSFTKKATIEAFIC